MEYRTIGRTDIKVSITALGCWALAGEPEWGRVEEREAIDTIHAALESGVNFFDTAEAYGNGRSEERLGKALEGRRKEAVIATKFSARRLTGEAITEACNESLRRLRTDVIDLYQIHWPGRTLPLAEQLGAMERLREQGKVRAIGVCNCGPRDMEALLAAGRFESNQLAYNLLWRAVEFEIMDLCRANDISILPYSPLMQGLLTGKFKSPDDVPPQRARTRHFSKDRPNVRHGREGCERETFETIDRIRAVSERIGRPMSCVALAWLLRRPSVASVLAGAKSQEQVRANVGAASLRLDDDIVEELSAITDGLKRRLGPEADMWAAQSRIR